MDTITLLTILLIIVVIMQAVQAFQVYNIYNLVTSGNFALAASNSVSGNVQNNQPRISGQIVVPSQVGGC